MTQWSKQSHGRHLFYLSLLLFALFFLIHTVNRSQIVETKREIDISQKGLNDRCVEANFQIIKNQNMICSFVFQSNL